MMSPMAKLEDAEQITSLHLGTNLFDKEPERYASPVPLPVEYFLDDSKGTQNYFVDDSTGTRNPDFTEKRAAGLKRKTGTGQLAFSCSSCGQFCSTAKSLEARMRKHDAEDIGHQIDRECSRFTENAADEPKPFVCSQCGKSFTRRSCFWQHTKIHSGVRRFQCHVCSKAFVASGNLQSHMVVHTRDRPFVCSKCGKRFGRSYDLKEHIRCHTGERIQ